MQNTNVMLPVGNIIFFSKELFNHFFIGCATPRSSFASAMPDFSLFLSTLVVARVEKRNASFFEATQ